MANSQAKPLSVLAVFTLSLAAGVGLIGTTYLISDNALFLLAVPMALIFLVWLVVSPKWLLAVLFCMRSLLDPFFNTTKIGVMEERMGIGGVLNLLIVLLVLTLLFRHAEHAKIAFRRIRYWSLFLILSAFSMLYTPVPVSALKLLLNLTTYMLIFLVPFIIVDDENDGKFWIAVLFFSTVLPVFVCNFALITNHPFFFNNRWFEGLRLKGTFTHPNILAFYLLFAVVLCFYILKTKPKKLGFWSFAALILYLMNLLVLLVATKTRSAWIACFGFFLVYGFLKERKYVILALLATILLSAVPSVRDRVFEIISGTPAVTGVRLNSYEWRLKLWSNSLEMTKERFWTGHGLASFQPLSREFFFNPGKTATSHNTFLGILFESGIVTLLSYILIFVAMLRSLITARFTQASNEYARIILFSYIFGYLCTSTVDNLNYYLAFNWYFWFFMGVSLKVLSLANSKFQ